MVKESTNWEILFQHNYLPKDYNLNYIKNSYKIVRKKRGKYKCKQNFPNVLQKRKHKCPVNIAKAAQFKNNEDM